MSDGMQPSRPIDRPQRKVIICLIVSPLLSIFTLMFVPIMFRDLTVLGSYYLFVVLLLAFVFLWQLICRRRYGKAAITAGIPMMVVMPGFLGFPRFVIELVYGLFR
jgi:hypothetical protein